MAGLIAGRIVNTVIDFLETVDLFVVLDDFYNGMAPYDKVLPG